MVNEEDDRVRSSLLISADRSTPPRLRKATFFPLFRTCKCGVAIPVFGPLHHDVLRQSALDPSVTRIDFVEAVAVGETSVRLDAVMLSRGAERRIVEIIGSGNDQPRDLDDEGLYLLATERLAATPLTLSTTQIRREPVCGNARRIWGESRRFVDLERRTAIADLLHETGPTSLSVIDRKFGGRAVRDVFALACETTLEIDIGKRLERAVVTLGPAAPGRRCGSDGLQGRRA